MAKERERQKQQADPTNTFSFPLFFSTGQGAWQPHGNLSTFSIPIPPRNPRQFGAEACGEGALRGHSGAEHLLCGPEECTDPLEGASAVDTGGWSLGVGVSLYTKDNRRG